MNEFLPINLPSRCKLYEGVEPGGVSIRAYQGQDEILLAQINPVNLERNYLAILRGLIRGVRPELLTLGDRLHIIIWECINSYTDIIKLQTICPSCVKEVEISVDLKELDTQYLQEDFEQPYEVELPVSGEKVALRLLTVADDVEFEKYNQTHDDGMLYRYARTIVTEQNILQVLERMKHMAAKDILRIMAFHDKFYHGPIMEASFVCPKCGVEGRTDVPFQYDFLFPDGSSIEESYGKGI